jgi:hypothetical protein
MSKVISDGLDSSLAIRASTIGRWHGKGGGWRWKEEEEERLLCCVM